MRRLWFLIAVVVVLAAVAVVGIAMFAHHLLAASPLNLKLVHVEDVADSAMTHGAPGRIVTLRLSNRSSQTISLPNLPENQRVQARLADGWRQREQLPEPSADRLASRTGTAYIVFAVPPAAEACRLLLDYRVGTSPYCKAYFFFQRYGLTRRFPTFSHAIVSRFPQKTAIRHATFDLLLPASRLETVQL